MSGEFCFSLVLMNEKSTVTNSHLMAPQRVVLRPAGIKGTFTQDKTTTGNDTYAAESQMTGQKEEFPKPVVG